MEELIVLCKLVRMAVFGKEEAIPTCVNWPKAFADAGINGVSALCYEAIKILPADRQPDFGLQLRWDLSAQEIREGFYRRREVTAELRGLLEERGIGMLLLKGETLADNYPCPELRESGDVDFIARIDYDGCNSFIESLGIEVIYQDKHSAFVYKGVHFENHTIEPTGGYNRVHHRTMALLRESMPDTVWRRDGCMELDPVTNAVFVVKHAAQHICYSGGRISLRMLLDLALLLRRHPDVLEKWEPKLRQVGLWRFPRVMLCAADQLFGTGFRSDWSSFMARRANRFISLFLTDFNHGVRYFEKFTFLPLRPSEMLRLWFEKAKRMIQTGHIC